ncbi:hypothetical protein GGR51DRAFT_575697 [Nemania sp. FL0031]|nr:hypothetical protein GGR51DRAFT_575697 [Nemania sp. FL0031]
MDIINNTIRQAQDSNGLKGQCVIKIRDALKTNKSNIDILNNFVNRAGEIVSDPLATPNVLAGIDYKACVKYCGYGQIPSVFSLQAFTSGATNYLFPWLALTAQLPFEAGENEVLAHVMSFSYAVGSPMLITYSLAITILNQHWLRGRFRKLESQDRPLHLTSKNIRIFLQESQQLPLRLSQEGGSLASLIVLRDNVDWWEKLKTSILLTRRGVTLSLIAQILVAVLSWILTVLSAFEYSLGDASAALALSSGSLWAWLVNGRQNMGSVHRDKNKAETAIQVPIICGWIMVGTQRQYGTIASALKRDMIYISQHNGANRSGSNANGLSGNGREIRIGERQKAFKVARERRLMPSSTNSSKEGPHIPNCLGFSVAGDEKQEGPAFNYARIFTWWNMANRIYQALEETDQRRHRGDRRTNDSCVELSKYCGLSADGRPKEINEYPCWSQLDSEFYQRMVVATAIAVYVQWGTIGASIIIAYLTEVTGLSCRSGGYVLYGTLATLTFLSLLLSSIFSHAAMLRHEALKASRVPSQRPRLGHNILRFCAVVTRMLGRTLAVANTIWIIVSTLWEFVGFYDNCWCNSTYLSKGNRGWFLLFIDRHDMAPAAVAPWDGVFFLSIFVSATSIGVFWLYCRGNRS